jgi:hypothetical protein
LIDLFIVFNATFSNISVLVVGEAEYPERTTDHGQATGKLYPLLHPFCNLQRRARTHAVLMIGLYELLGNETTELIEPPRHSLHLLYMYLYFLYLLFN